MGDKLTPAERARLRDLQFHGTCIDATPEKCIQAWDAIKKLLEDDPSDAYLSRLSLTFRP